MDAEKNEYAEEAQEVRLEKKEARRLERPCYHGMISSCEEFVTNGVIK